MAWLLLTALLWIFVHVGISGTGLRGMVAAWIGEGAYRGVFSGLSFVTIALLVRAWGAAETTPLWTAPGWLRWVLVLLMLPAFILFVAAVVKPNPTAIGGERELGTEPRGIQRVTRHPMLWAFALWAFVHLVGNGDSAAIVFFGAFLVTALAGMPSIDGKLARRAPGAWARLAASTSILPFGAIAAGRNRLVLGEIGWIPPVVGLVAWAALLHFHRGLFGVAPVLMGG
jgi:uncharacterized membrane protein